MASSGMLCHVVLVRINVSEELSASIIRVTRIGELFLHSMHRLLVTAMFLVEEWRLLGCYAVWLL
jgi:hypothetical protein